ncbi:hypothetical protein [Pararhizobium sp. IMCC21322]|uniref:hypothetical protein n=1 Tax=Pararhizobium sp. IMCC21322 TaxID=3067903 RepID=UPI0027426A96|nr:hypothetical protein [Pararhizobium sp. IMCC21322]
MQMHSHQPLKQVHGLALPCRRSASKTRLVITAVRGLRTIARFIIAYMAYRAVLKTHQFLLKSPHPLLNDIGLTHADLLRTQNAIRFSDFWQAKP